MRIGLLGVAGITEGALIEPSRLMPNVVLQGIASRTPCKAKTFAELHGIVNVYDDYAALVSSSDIDLVYNALPISLHATWSINALKAGKHVLCEKPLAMNSMQVIRMLDEAQDSGARLIEAFHHRYHPAFETFLSWLADGALGEISTITTHFNVGIADDGANIRYRPDLGGGAMMDLGCYPVSWALSAADSTPVSITAKATLTSTGVDESMTAQLEFPNEIVANLSCSMAANQVMSNAIHVAGELGEIEFEKPLLPHNGGALTRTINGIKETATIDSGSTYRHQLAAVVDALDQSKPLPTEGLQLLLQQQTLDLIYQHAGLEHLRYRRNTVIRQ